MISLLFPISCGILNCVYEKKEANEAESSMVKYTLYIQNMQIFFAVIQMFFLTAHSDLENKHVITLPT